MEKKNILLRIPKVLLDRVDQYQQTHGFSTRTQTIMHLIHVGLDVKN